MTENHSFGCYDDQVAMGLHDFGLGKSQVYQKLKDITEELKQKAENFIIDRYKLNECYREDNEETREYMRMDVHSQYEEEYQLYFAGLHEGQPKWHDLRKDPNDLPKENELYLVFGYTNKREKFYELDVFDPKEGEFLGCGEYVYAWCEIPTFKE